MDQTLIIVIMCTTRGQLDTILKPYMMIIKYTRLILRMRWPTVAFLMIKMKHLTQHILQVSIITNLSTMLTRSLPKDGIKYRKSITGQLVKSSV